MTSVRGRWLVGFAVVVALVPTHAVAEPRPHRLTVAGTLAGGSFWSDESRLGGGAIVGGAVRVQPWSRWGLEVNVRRSTYERRFVSSVVFAGEGVELTGTVVYYFRAAGLRPFISGGIGVLRSARETRFPILAELVVSARRPPIIGEEVLRVTDTNAGLSVSGGIDVPLGNRWSLRPEVRLLVGADSLLSALDLGGSLAYGW